MVILPTSVTFFTFATRACKFSINYTFVSLSLFITFRRTCRFSRVRLKHKRTDIWQDFRLSVTFASRKIMYYQQNKYISFHLYSCILNKRKHLRILIFFPLLQVGLFAIKNKARHVEFQIQPFSRAFVSYVFMYVKYREFVHVLFISCFRCFIFCVHVLLIRCCI